MTPKEKCNELFNKYCLALKTEETDQGYFTNIIQAEQYVLIAVDEILDNCENIFDAEYWEEVKTEIELL